MLRRGLLLLLFVAGVVSPSVAQDSTCTYDTCGLRLRFRVFHGIDVTRGAANERVAGYSFFGFAPRLPMLESRTDSARVFYDAFRRLNNRGTWLELVGGAALLTGYALAMVDEDRAGLGVALVLGGGIPLIWGATDHLRARDRLSRAIWWYNRGLR